MGDKKAGVSTQQTSLIGIKASTLSPRKFYLILTPSPLGEQPLSHLAGKKDRKREETIAGGCVKCCAADAPTAEATPSSVLLGSEALGAGGDPKLSSQAGARASSPHCQALTTTQTSLYSPGAAA